MTSYATVGMSVPMVARYAREADQREKALAAHQRREPAAVIKIGQTHKH